jgi:alcohol dehydrogenase YqhD (iron-dependent ADH family)
MLNFKIDNPTVIHFGRDVINDLGRVINNISSKMYYCWIINFKV